MKDIPNAHNGAIFAVSCLHNGQLATGSEDKTVKLWDLMVNKNF